MGVEGATTDSAAGGLQGCGREIIGKFVEANRYWLVAPPSSVKNFSYVLNRVSGSQEFAVTDPARTPRARLQGVTYSTLIHQLARKPQSATVTEIVEERGKVRLALSFEPGIRGAIGNGVENSWNGYHSLGGGSGYLVLDTARWVPLEAGVGRLTENFGEYAQVDEQHYVPLAIREQVGDTRYDWRFRLYEPGLWLFDESFSDGRRLAWVDGVKVNSAEPKLVKATAASLELEERVKVGQARMQGFLEANRHWLLPSLQARHGLVYEYRQEAPYRERVLFAGDGDVMARLEASKESPDGATRQRLWLADGRSYAGDAGDQFVKLEGGASTGASPKAWLQRDRIVQHLAMGLALDCALTRLAREPDGFWAEVRPVADRGDRYLLVLHPKRDARLFTGTMLTFSSWSFMHDVGYDRSEVVCDAVSHRPMEEKDYAGEKDLKGDYLFEDWMADASGAAPGRIRAVIPNEKDGKDQALEMDARFHFAGAGVWLLDRVESHFRGGAGGSTGTVTVLAGTSESYRPIAELVEKARATERVLEAVQQAPSGVVEQKLKAGEWSPLALKAAWTEKAREGAQARDESGRNDARAQSMLIGIHRARMIETPEGLTRLELEGLSTVSWKEFRTEWKVGLRDAQGREVSTLTTNVTVRAEGAPAPFLVRFDLRRAATPSLPQAVSVEGTVERMSGAYHGHGMWYRFAQKD